jgi:hypothetical protein
MQTSITVYNGGYANGQVERAISTSASANPADLVWQLGTTFNGLSPNTTYYVYIRFREIDHYYASEASRSDPIMTLP